MMRAQQGWIKEAPHKPYTKGEKVWLKGKNLQTSHPTTKLRPKRFRPFTIIKVLGPTTYRLGLPAAWKIHNAFHGTLLTPNVETVEHGVNFTELPPDIIGGEQQYKVEHILGAQRSGRGKQLQYLVQWKGYSAAHNSWEPKANVQAPRLVKEFYKREPTAIKRVILDCNPTELRHSVKPLPPCVPGRSFPLYPKTGHHQHHWSHLRQQKLPHLFYEHSFICGHTQHINTTSLFQDNASTSPIPTPWNTCTSARKNTAISISKMSNSPFLQYPGAGPDNGSWDTNFATGDSLIGTILNQNLPRTTLPHCTTGFELPDYKNSDTAVEADISMPLTPALVEPERELAAMPFLEDIFQGLLALEDGHPGHPWF